MSKSLKLLHSTIILILAGGDHHLLQDSSRWFHHGTPVWINVKYLWQKKSEYPISKLDVTWFRNSLQIHIQKTLARLCAFISCLRDHTLNLDRKVSHSQLRNRQIGDTKKLQSVYVAYFPRDYWSQLYFLHMGLDNGPFLKMFLSQGPKAQSSMSLFSVILEQRQLLGSWVHDWNIFCVKFTINEFSTGSLNRLALPNHSELRHPWRRMKGHFLRVCIFTS